MIDNHKMKVVVVTIQSEGDPSWVVVYDNFESAVASVVGHMADGHDLEHTAPTEQLIESLTSRGVVCTIDYRKQEASFEDPLLGHIMTIEQKELRTHTDFLLG